MEKIIDWLAIAIFVNTIIGAGIFFLPGYVYSLGLIPFVLLAFFSFLTLYLLGVMIYDMLETLPRGENHLFRIVEIFGGRKLAYIFLVAFLTTMYSLLSSYIEVFSEGISWALGLREEIVGMLFYIFAAVIIIAGLRKMSYVLVFSYLLLISLLTVSSVLLILSGGHIVPLLSEKVFSLEFFVLSIFSLMGHSILPEVYLLRRRSYKEILFYGLAIPLFLSILYSLAFSSYFGYSFPEKRIFSKIILFPKPIFLILIFFSILSLFTSFVGVGISLRDLLSWDVGIKRSEAIFYTLFLPLIFYILSKHLGVDVLNVILNVSGSMWSLAVVILACSYIRGISSRKITKYSVAYPTLVGYFMVVMFLVMFLFLLPIPK